MIRMTGGSIYELHYGGAAFISGGTAFVGAAENTTVSYTFAETHSHDQPHNRPLEAVEAFTVAPVALTVVSYAVARRVVKWSRGQGVAEHGDIPHADGM